MEAIIILIFAIIGFVLNRAKDNTGRPDRKTAVPPRERAEVPDMLPVRPELDRRSRTAGDFTASAADKRVSDKVLIEARDRLQQLKDEEDSVRRVKRFKEPEQAEKAVESPLSQDGLSRESIVHGIIMAEILGPSRAKKPYKPIK